MQNLLRSIATSRSLALVCLAFVLGGCESRPAPAPGTLSLREIGRNESQVDAAWCGTLFPGSRQTIRGHVGSQGPDRFDGYAFTAGAPCTLRIRLHPSVPGTELDLCSLGVPSGTVQHLCAGSQGIEVSELQLDREGLALQLVVSSTWGSSAYVLEIESLPVETSAARAVSSPDRRVLERMRIYAGSGSSQPIARPADQLPEFVSLLRWPGL